MVMEFSPAAVVDPQVVTGQSGHKTKSRRTPFCLLFLSLIMIFLGLFIGLYLPKAIDDSLMESSTVCSPRDSDFDDWRTNLRSDAPPLYKNTYGFSIDNPVEYLQGETAEVIESGPYVIRLYESNLDTKFSRGRATYQTYTLYDLQEEMSCPGCTVLDLMSNLNPAYLGLIGSAHSEGLLFLSTRCTTTQIGMVATFIGDNTTPVCTLGEMGGSTACACCYPTPSAPDGYSTCAAIYDHSTTTAGLFSLFAEYDGGYKVTDTPTAFGQAGIYSELVVEKAITEFGFGYPNALVGYIASSTAAKQFGAAGLAGFAAYTDQIGAMCSEFCTGTFPSLTCAGRVGPRETIADATLRYLGHTNCLPYTATALTETLCFLAEQDGGSSCVCANGGAPPCCLAGGSINYVGDPLGLGFPDIIMPSLVGLGCLYQVGGYIDDIIYATEDIYRDINSQTNEQITGCDTGEDHLTQYTTRYYDVSSYQYWMNTAVDGAGNQRPPTTVDLATLKAVPAAASFVSRVYGGGGKQVPARGLTSDMFEAEISDGQRGADSYTLFVGEARRNLEVYYEGPVEVKGVKANRFRPAETLLDNTAENQGLGAGVPLSGVQCLTYVRNFPAYISRPMYAYGDQELLSQSDNSAYFMSSSSSRGGLNIYSKNSYTSPYAEHDTPVLVDTESQSANINVYMTNVDIEAATGKTISAHKALMGSIGVWSCDVTRVSSCGLFPHYVEEEGVTGDCYGLATGGTNYPCSAMNVFTPRVLGDKMIPQYWIDENAELTDDQADDVEAAGKANQAAGVVLMIITPFGVALFLYAAHALYQINAEAKGKQPLPLPVLAFAAAIALAPFIAMIAAARASATS